MDGSLITSPTMLVARYEDTVKAIVSCRAIDEAKFFADRAIALEALAKVQKDRRMEREAKAERLWAFRKMGELARVMRPGRSGALEDAKDFLIETLDHGPVEGKVIYRQAEDAGHAKRTIDRAKRELGIRSSKGSMNSPWRWELPPKVAKVAEGCHTKLMATFDDVGNLRTPSEEAF